MNKFVGTVENRDAIMRFVNSHDAERLAELGTSCPDHFLADQDQTALCRLGPTKHRRKMIRMGC